MKRIWLLIICALLTLSLTGCGDNNRVEELSITADRDDLLTTETMNVTVSILPDDVEEIGLTWSSSDTDVFTVDGPESSDGSAAAAVVKPVGPGTAELTVKSKNGTTAELTISVREPVEVSEVSLSESSINLLTGQSAELIASYSPSNADFPEITVTSSDPSVAAFSDGTVTAVSEGTAIITASASNGVKATCTVSVRDPIEVSVIDAGRDLTLLLGETKTLSPDISPKNADDRSYSVSSSDETVVTVSGNTITAVGEGTAVVTVTASNGVSDSCSVTVRKPIEVDTVTLSDSELTVLLNGTATLTASVSPENADNKALVWTTSDSSIATVNGGTVTGTREGTVTVTATAASGVSACCTVTVTRMTPAMLDELLGQQPLYVSSTKYVVQSDRWKALYPDMLQAVITNNSADTIRNAIVAFVAWDSNGLPIKIVPDNNFSGGAYVVRCSYADVNLLPGKSYGSSSGLELYDSKQTEIGSFKACVISYETFDGKTWENPYYEKFIEMYAEKPLA